VCQTARNFDPPDRRANLMRWTAPAPGIEVP
jgi:hypothetical protein